LKTENVKVLCPVCKGKGEVQETLWKPEGDASGITSYGTEKINVICPNPYCHGEGWVWAEKLI